MKGLYKKRGFYYWQPPQKNLVRPKAIALRTKEFDEALKKLGEIEQGFEPAKYIESGNVYLMKNDLNGRIKIGRTKDKPVYRERTLQSQEPEVNLIFYRKVSDMSETEKHLHALFASKRFRGEWFDLSQEDIEEAKSIIERASNDIKTKTCTKCGEEKLLGDFNKVVKNSEKRRAKCKKCETEQQNERRKIRRKEDPEYRAKENARSRQWKIDNRDKHLSYRRGYEKEKYHNDPNYKLTHWYKNTINRAIDGKISGKLKFLGCSIDEFRVHIESQFEEGMSWDNHSINGWHIDHILPLSAAKGDVGKIKALNHYTNLRPMWSTENISKLDKHCPEELEEYLQKIESLDL